MNVTNEDGYGVVFVTGHRARWEHWRVAILSAISEHVPVMMVHPLGARRGWLRMAATMIDRRSLQPIAPAGRGKFEVGVGALLPGGRFEAISRPNRALIGAHARRSMAAAGITHGAFWFQHPTWQDAWQRVSDRLVSVYDCDDLYEAFPDSSARVRARARAAEAALMAAPGVAFAASEPLLEHLRGFDSPRLLHLLPNVPTAPVKEPRLPGGVDGLRRPVVGLIGNIDDRYDFALLAAVADAIPDGTLLLAGSIALAESQRVESGYQALVERPNVRGTGQLAPDELLGVAGVLDVGLLPYRPTPVNLAASPVKVFDYLHARVPVVSTGVSRLASAARWVRVAESTEAFVNAVQEAVRSGRIGHDIDAWLSANTAEARAREALEVLSAAST